MSRTGQLPPFLTEVALQPLLPEPLQGYAVLLDVSGVSKATVKTLGRKPKISHYLWYVKTLFDKFYAIDFL